MAGGSGGYLMAGGGVGLYLMAGGGGDIFDGRRRRGIYLMRGRPVDGWTATGGKLPPSGLSNDIFRRETRKDQSNGKETGLGSGGVPPSISSATAEAPQSGCCKMTFLGHFFGQNTKFFRPCGAIC